VEGVAWGISVGTDVKVGAGSSTIESTTSCVAVITKGVAVGSLCDEKPQANPIKIKKLIKNSMGLKVCMITPDN
jgi:hypothetical protein